MKFIKISDTEWIFQNSMYKIVKGNKVDKMGYISSMAVRKIYMDFVIFKRSQTIYQTRINGSKIMKELIAKKAQLMKDYLKCNALINEFNFHVCITTMHNILKEVSILEKKIGKEHENMVW